MVPTYKTGFFEYSRQTPPLSSYPSFFLYSHILFFFLEPLSLSQNSFIFISKQWLEMEKLGQLHDLVLIMGRKIELLTEKDVPLLPTYHRVCIDRTVRRHSILFFYDLLTSNDD